MLVEGQTRFLALGIFAKASVNLYSFPDWAATAGQPAEAAQPEAEAVTIYYEDNAQVELISPAGVRVLVDVWNHTLLSAPPTESDILLTTHGHPDHYSQVFIDAFPGQKLTVQTGKLSVEDVTIVSIPSAHNVTDNLPEEGASNYIFIVDVAGLRVAHFGDIGQEALTDEQLTALGEVDIAITQFNNSYSTMNLQNMKGFNLMDQVQPKLIIPTHTALDVLEIVAEKWEGFQTQTWPILVDRSMLVEGQTRFLAVGVYAKASENLHSFPDWATAAEQ
jgi:L-ascorbate metabolism protein UlaG (beta-lactamase superfamily)